MDRALKMLFNEGWGSFLRPSVPELCGFYEINCTVCWTKYMHKHKKIFNNFLSQNQEFLPPKSTTKYSFE